MARPPTTEVIKGVLFDFHDTLVKCDRWLQLEVFTLAGDALRLLESRGVVSDVEKVLHAANGIYFDLRREVMASGREMDAVDGLAATLQRLGITVGKTALDEAVEELERGCLEDTSIVDHALETVQQLKTEGYRLAVVSSAAYTQFVLWALERYQLKPYFDIIVTSSDTGYYKSDPAIYRQAVADLHLQTDECVHVGDSYKFDVLGAKRAGLKVVWLKRGNDDDVDESVPDAVILSLSELIDQVRKW